MNLLFISLGCDKNLVDSEVMLGLLDAKGYQMVDDETQADVIVPPQPGQSGHRKLSQEPHPPPESPQESPAGTAGQGIYRKMTISHNI